MRSLRSAWTIREVSETIEEGDMLGCWVLGSPFLFWNHSSCAWRGCPRYEVTNSSRWTPADSLIDCRQSASCMRERTLDGKRALPTTSHPSTKIDDQVHPSTRSHLFRTQTARCPKDTKPTSTWTLRTMRPKQTCGTRLFSGISTSRTLTPRLLNAMYSYSKAKTWMHWSRTFSTPMADVSGRRSSHCVST